MNVTIGPATRASGLSLGPDGVLWSGPADVEPGAPLVSWTLHAAPEHPHHRAVAAADPGAIGALAREAPMPACLLAELAARCLEVSPPMALAIATGRVAADARWARALAAAAYRSGELEVQAPRQAEPRILLRHSATLRVTHVRVLPGDRLAVLEAPIDRRTNVARLWLVLPSGERRSLELRADPGESLALPRPARADPGSLVVTAFDATRHVVTVRLIDDRGESGMSVGDLARVPLGSHPHEISRAAGLVWVHGEGHHVAYRSPAAGDAREATVTFERGFDPHPAAIVGSWLARFHNVLEPGIGYLSKTIDWVDLDGARPTLAVPWARQHNSAVARDDALWLATDEGVFRLPAGCVAERVFEAPAFGLLVRAGEIVVGGRQAVVCLDRTRFAEKWRTAVGHPVYAIEETPGGLLAASIWRWTWLDERGVIRQASDQRRDVGTARLEDGSFAVSAGEDVLIVGADGSPRRRLRLDYDGRILGATSTCFVFGPVSGGVPRIQPRGLTAMNGDGVVVSRVTSNQAPSRTIYAGGSTRDGGAFASDRVLLVDEDGSLREWSPAARSAASPGPAVPPARATERGVDRRGAQTFNPRDDWSEPGVEVWGAELYADGCTYGGTTGVARGPALLVGDAAIATLVRCRLANGGLGKLVQSSTAILVDCVIESTPGEAWEIGEGCHLALVDCRIESPIDLNVAHGASVTAQGATITALREEAGRRLRVTSA